MMSLRDERIRLRHHGLPADTYLELVFAQGVLSYELYADAGAMPLVKNTWRMQLHELGNAAGTKIEGFMRRALLSVARHLGQPELDAYRQALTCELLDLVDVGAFSEQLVRDFGQFVEALLLGVSDWRQPASKTVSAVRTVQHLH